MYAGFRNEGDGCKSPSGLGYTPKYIDSKFDDIVDFSELQDFLDVPLKNYSSGMVARLAFAVATP